MIPGLTLAAGLLASAATAATGNPVSIANRSISKTTTDGSAALASFTFRTDRTVKNQDGTTINSAWLDAAYSPSDYQVRATLISGNAPSGSSLSTWLSLSTNRTWSLTDAAGATGTKTCKLTIEIRDASAPNTLRDSATFTLTADSQSGSTVNWADISSTGPSSTVTGSNADQAMTAAGTLTFAYDADLSMTFAVFKNGASIGAPASVTVVIGDTIHFSSTVTGVISGETRVGSITVGGLASDVIPVQLDRI